MSRPTDKVGKAGEYLTASILSIVCEDVVLTTPPSTTDIIFQYQDRLYKCQVKAKSKIEPTRGNWRFDLRRSGNTKDRQYKDKTVDIFALVSLPYRNVIFVPKIQQSQITFVDEHMKNNDAINNLLDVLDNL